MAAGSLAVQKGEQAAPPVSFRIQKQARGLDLLSSPLLGIGLALLGLLPLFLA